MADDVTGGQVLDPDAAENTVVAGAPAAKEEKPEFKATEDGNLIEYGGRKYLREEAVHEARGKAAKYAETLQTLEPLMGEFEQFLEAKRGGQRATVDRATRQSRTDDEYSDDELTGYAITRGYYDADNKPDTKRAKDDLDIMTAIADRRASKAVRPVAESTVRDRAQENYERALSYRFSDGEPVAEEKYLRAALDAIRQDSPDTLADPKAAELVQVIAAGLQSLDERKTGRRASRGREPVFREGASNRNNYGRGGEELDALDRAAARARGKSPEAWAKLQKQVGGGSGTGTVLEEI